MARDPYTKDCVLKGCKRAEYKAHLCREHWHSVPYAERVQVAIRVMDAGHRAAKREHVRIRRIAREIAAQG